MSDDENITKLPVRFKAPLPEGRSIMCAWEAGRAGPCNHLFATYLIEDGGAEVTCGRCNGKLDPMWVLGRLATEDRRMAESQARYQDEMKRLDERKRTKCRHCGNLTPISRAKAR